MTAAELASFRTLLQAQAPSQPKPDGGLFARMRARLTLVERTEPPSGETPVAPPRPSVAPPRLVAMSWEAQDVSVADPPLSTPPVFGRRETSFYVESAPPIAPPDTERSPPAAAPELAAVRLRRSVLLQETHATPDELSIEPRPPSSAEAPAPGTIGGWSRSRPASAQRRILQRLEAVFTAEFEGLEARIAADAPAR